MYRDISKPGREAPVPTSAASLNLRLALVFSALALPGLFLGAYAVPGAAFAAAAVFFAYRALECALDVQEATMKLLDRIARRITRGERT